MAPPTVVTSATPRPSSSVSNAIRVVISIVLSIPIALFILVWNAGYIPHNGIPVWVGNMIFMPLIATGLSLGANCLIQQLSCSKIDIITQLEIVAVTPLPYFLMWLLLRFIPSMRWPIEGLIQYISPNIRNALSSTFYTFWVSMYTLGFLNSVAQICPT